MHTLYHYSTTVLPAALAHYLMLNRQLILLLLIMAALRCHAQDVVEYSVSAMGNASTGDFAPYMIGSWRHGKMPQKSSVLLDAAVCKPMDSTKRFSYALAAEFITGYSHRPQYDHWDQEEQAWTKQTAGPSALWIQQLYGEIKYRSIFATLGYKEHSSALLNNRLSSGDFTESGNARPMPELRVGLIDFEDIPFTNGWLQIQGEVSYARMMDDNYLQKQYNHYNYHIHLKNRYSYRRCFFRTNPSRPFSATVGMQVATFFAGYADYYGSGQFKYARIAKESFLGFFKILFPMGENGEDYYVGSSLGSWDLHLRYRLKSGQDLIAYFQGPWEDGSGIGRMNRFDGLWGLEYRSNRRALVSGAVFEYLDFRDQSGPIHWAPADHPGVTIINEATGFDDYYNNYFYNSYANYGMSIGTPFLMSPIYNLNGYIAYVCNRVNGFHAGMLGNLSPVVDYRMLVSYQRGLGTYRVPYSTPRTCTSLLVEAGWDARSITPGLSLRLECALDGGSLRGNNLGFAFTLSYTARTPTPKRLTTNN